MRGEVIDMAKQDDPTGNGFIAVLDCHEIAHESERLREKLCKLFGGKTGILRITVEHLEEGDA